MLKFIEKQDIKDYLKIMIGITLTAIGINVFFKPNQLVIGGLSGLGIVIEHVANIPISVTNILVNIPLFILAIKLKGKAFAGKSVFAALYLSVALTYTSYLPPQEGLDMMLVSIFGSVLLGSGIGIVLKIPASTGGSDLTAVIINHFFKSIPIAKIMACCDTIIIICGIMVFGIEKGLYAIIAVYIISTVVDRIVSGGSASKTVHIISQKSQEISIALMKSLNRGVTGLQGTGMYTNEDKKILFVVCDQKELVILQNIVKEIDDKAFLTITDIKEVYGRGFTQPKFEIEK
ncbi:YitT family protein [Clostridium senegalense]|uniref:YitT family protein n=1 Tax=Clostridium senegalense TaxID=1465809 RepID=UPI000287AE3A|nr:YitT family protein [Clostridium senegalense]